ncbi:hypothetical protein B0T18DRAFT_135382 [Schizothecium vesticola]|uniref:Uncharacterized protein n=1 Tax=Schizothecium vesticola TaxID=314040 RepID=A0AA40K4J8_9PEZI|nr:hypothetical protein B0T18DRAFT_135382 [Schizothecium vesticola]
MVRCRCKYLNRYVLILKSSIVNASPLHGRFSTAFDASGWGRSSSAPTRALRLPGSQPAPGRLLEVAQAFMQGVLLPGRARHVRSLQCLSVFGVSTQTCQLRHFSTSRQSLPYKTPTSMLSAQVLPTPQSFLKKAFGSIHSSSFTPLWAVIWLLRWCPIFARPRASITPVTHRLASAHSALQSRTAAAASCKASPSGTLPPMLGKNNGTRAQPYKYPFL